MKILKNVSLKSFNTFGIDVAADFMADIMTEGELVEILNLSEYHIHNKLILGGGSNILLTRNFKGLVIKISIPGIRIISENEKEVFIKSGSGVIWHDLVLFCIEKNYGGIENLSLIPGTVGAAPIQNIGAYGQELKDVFYKLEGFYIDNQQKAEFDRDECRFGYRESIFKNELKNKFIISSVTLRLSKNPVINLDYGTLKNEIAKLGKDRISVKDVSEVVCMIRKSKLPDPVEIGNAGSFFKNPEINEKKFGELREEFPDIIGFKMDDGKIKVAAGWLVEKCGWKGKRVGETGAHAKQALVLVNYGKATGKEILQLSEKIRDSVYEKFGINLAREVNIV